MMPGRFIHYSDLRVNDVLFGRGAFTDRYQGNVCFRSLVADRKSMHAATTLVAEKTSLVFEVREIVWRSGGRFLRRIDSAEATRLGWIEGVNETTIWEPVDEEVTLEKIKQAFRDIALMPRAQDTNQTCQRKAPPQQGRLADCSKRQKTDSTAVKHQSLPIPASIAFMNQGDNDRKMPPKNPTTKFSAAELQEKDSRGIFTRAQLIELVKRYQAQLDEKRRKQRREAAQTRAATAGSHVDSFDPAPAVGFDTQARMPELANLEAPFPSSVEAPSAQTMVSQDNGNHEIGNNSARPNDARVATAVQSNSDWRDILGLYETGLSQLYRFEAPPFSSLDWKALTQIRYLAVAEGDVNALNRLDSFCVQLAHLPTGQLQLSLVELECLRAIIECFEFMTSNI